MYSITSRPASSNTCSNLHQPATEICWPHFFHHIPFLGVLWQVLFRCPCDHLLRLSQECCTKTAINSINWSLYLYNTCVVTLFKPQSQTVPPRRNQSAHNLYRTPCEQRKVRCNNKSSLTWLQWPVSAASCRLPWTAQGSRDESSSMLQPWKQQYCY